MLCKFHCGILPIGKASWHECHISTRGPQNYLLLTSLCTSEAQDTVLICPHDSTKTIFHTNMVESSFSLLWSYQNIYLGNYYFWHQVKPVANQFSRFTSHNNMKKKWVTRVPTYVNAKWPIWWMLQCTWYCICHVVALWLFWIWKETSTCITQVINWRVVCIL